MAQYTIDIAERQASLAINRMYRRLAEDIASTRDIYTAIEHFGVSEQRRLYLSFMQAYAAGIVAANKDIRRNAPRRVAADYSAQETFPLEEDPYIARYTTEAIMGLKEIPLDDLDEIRWRLTHAISAGASIPSITDDLLKYFDGDRIRANRFARTATSDILNRATLHRYEDSGVVDGVKFMAHIDNRTSETCRVMNGTIWALNDPSIQTPPLHFNCFVEGTRLEPTSDIIAAFRARYNGQVVELTLSDGRRLTVTPNHHLLTPNGFLASKLVREGDNIICRSTFKGGVGGVDPYDDNVQPTVEEVFSALRISHGMRTESMPATAVDFNNDGEFVEGNVNVITPDCFLGSSRDTSLIEHFNKDEFSTSCHGLRGFQSDGDLAPMLIGLADAADSRMSSIRKTSSFFGGRVTHPDIHSLASVSRDDSNFVEAINDYRMSDFQLPRDRLNRCPSIVHGTESDKIDVFPVRQFQSKFFDARSNNANGYPEIRSNVSDRQPIVIHSTKGDEVNVLSAGSRNAHVFKPVIHSANADPKQLRHLLNMHSRMIDVQKVVHVNVLPFHGYVYDFQTISTLCIGNGVVTSNCRSRIVAYFGKIPGARDYSKDFDLDTIDRAFQNTDTFRNKYWSRFPRTRSSAVLQRHYLSTVDIDIIRNGLTKLIQSPTMGVWDTDMAKRLKAILRYRRVERDSSIVVDAFGKSLLLDVAERAAIREGLAQLIRLQRLKISREIADLPIWSELARPGRERLIKEMQLTLTQYEQCLAELPFL